MLPWKHLHCVKEREETEKKIERKVRQTNFIRWEKKPRALATAQTQMAFLQIFFSCMGNAGSLSPKSVDSRVLNFLSLSSLHKLQVVTFHALYLYSNCPCFSAPLSSLQLPAASSVMSFILPFSPSPCQEKKTAR